MTDIREQEMQGKIDELTAQKTGRMAAQGPGRYPKAVFASSSVTIPIFRYKNTLLTVLFSKEGTYHLVLLRNLPFPTEAPFYSIG